MTDRIQLLAKSFGHVERDQTQAESTAPNQRPRDGGLQNW
jgi:hypothetical protein